MPENTTIAAIATGPGGALALIRVSGPEAIAVTDRVFWHPGGKRLADQPGFSIAYGDIRDGTRTVDDVLVSVFRAPRSYTGDDMAEISCHGSPYIQQEILRLLLCKGAVAAAPGEFTLRAFLHGKMGLLQAEAVADVIASDSRASHALAANQMRGGYSEEFRALRGRLIEVASLVELELDFGEEEVEFADRSQLLLLIDAIGEKIDSLKSSFALGNVIKNGVPVAIVGPPNVGKSTLLNALLKENRALVSDIAGTTRDLIEEEITLGGIRFRFIDTAGIRTTDDTLESMGIERTLQRMEQAAIVLLLTDIADDPAVLPVRIESLNLSTGQSLAIVLNKSDLLSEDELTARTEEWQRVWAETSFFALSAKSGQGLPQLSDYLCAAIRDERIERGDVIVSNVRHHEALIRASESLQHARAALTSALSGDLLSEDLRGVIHALDLITGDITTDDILSSIFSKFCIGK
ncbi:MAG: tRNA uridine-5-carboxymethylaminomethyl(34) synthesis GTPase MnmE [Rikenellaceae bacterium]|jgi:tRNA modification GTPase|nr:tRNA uridine-5-carboxymethylaminomethyl(34) synthesis GTPase MnmE [Rikenellaceae bacterium]